MSRRITAGTGLLCNYVYAEESRSQYCVKGPRGAKPRPGLWDTQRPGPLHAREAGVRAAAHTHAAVVTSATGQERVFPCERMMNELPRNTVRILDEDRTFGAVLSKEDLSAARRYAIASMTGSSLRP